MRKLVYCLLLSSLLAGQTPTACDASLNVSSIGGVCLPSTKSKCVNDCAIRCGDDGQCIFGCEVGQDFTVDRCYSDCNGFSPRCLDSCLQTIACIKKECESFNAQFKINAGAVVYNRAAGNWQQTVQLTNISCNPLTNLSFGLASLASGWTVTNSNMNPANGVGRMFGSVDPLGTAVVTLQFARTGLTALKYTPVINGTVPAVLEDPPLAMPNAGANVTLVVTGKSLYGALATVLLTAPDGSTITPAGLVHLDPNTPFTKFTIALTGLTGSFAQSGTTAVVTVITPLSSGQKSNPATYKFQ